MALLLVSLFLSTDSAEQAAKARVAGPPGWTVVFSALAAVTGPLGALVGAYRGYRAAHPHADIVSLGSERMLHEFKLRHHTLARADQQVEMALVLPEWIRDYRMALLVRVLVMFAVFALIFIASWLTSRVLMLVLVYMLYRTVRLVLDMRRGVKLIRAQWGDEVVDRLDPLPVTLR
ncbi:MAG: hypothetical protein DWQ37_20965 [Planctomycetota bacterium]|nr:MAG: hypothetical protein DWQ37_20965 [Planctomycetota bacterium]